MHRQTISCPNQCSVITHTRTSVQSHQLHDTVFVFLSRFVYQAARQSWSATPLQRHCMPAQRTAPLMPASVCTTTKAGRQTPEAIDINQMNQGTRRVQTSDSATTATTVHLQAIEQSPLSQSQVVPCRMTEVQASQASCTPSPALSQTCSQSRTSSTSDSNSGL